MGISEVLDHLPVYILRTYSEQKDFSYNYSSLLFSPPPPELCHPPLGSLFKGSRVEKRLQMPARTSAPLRAAFFKMDTFSYGGSESFKVNKQGTLIQMLLN